MTLSRTWAAYPPSYRAGEIATLAGWIRAGESGCVVGLAGSGKSNLFGFLCHRPEVLRQHLPEEAPPPALVLVDLNNLPGDSASGAEANFYRVILRALYEARARLVAIECSLVEAVETLYRRVEDKTDPFLSQSALREALLCFEERGARLVLVFDPFDTFCRTSSPHVIDSLRALRDSFKATLCYLVGLRQELAALRDPVDIGELYEILDMHQYWLGAMSAGDARWVIHQVQEATGHAFSELEVERLIALSGGYPSLLRATSLWLASTASPPGAEVWAECLLAERSIQRRLDEIWTRLAEEERRALSTLQVLHSSSVAAERLYADSQEDLNNALVEQHGPALARVVSMGLCHRVKDGWRIRGDLLARYVGHIHQEKADLIWLDESTRELYQGHTLLADLSPLERELLTFLVAHPQVRHTKTDLILNAWPEDPYPLERTDDSIYQVVRGLRSKIELNPSKPRYIITWRGAGGQEGGYQFFPEGREAIRQ